MVYLIHALRAALAAPTMIAFGAVVASSPAAAIRGCLRHLASRFVIQRPVIVVPQCGLHFALPLQEN
jgi:hypothetical protein